MTRIVQPMQPKSVHVVQSLRPEHGGTSVSVPGLADAVARDGRYENVVLHFGPAGPSDTWPLARVQACPTPGVGLLLPTAARSVLTQMVAGADVVHVHGIWGPHSLATIDLARRFRKPVVVSAHGMLDGWALRHKRWKKAAYAALIERRNLNRASCLRALTAVEVENFRAFGLSCPVAVIPNGVSAPSESSAEAFLDRYPSARGKRVVLFLGRLHAKKGVDVLLHAWQQVKDAFPDACLVLAGPDEGGLGRLTAASRDHLASSRVVITGMVTGALKWSAITASTLFVLPSHSEGLSMAALEALWLGVPILITPGCNFREAEQLDCTFMVEPSAHSVASGLAGALRRPSAELRRRGAVGSAFARERYSWARAGRLTADLYDQLRSGERYEAGREQLLAHAV